MFALKSWSMRNKRKPLSCLLVALMLFGMLPAGVWAKTAPAAVVDAPRTEWERTFGGSGWDWANSVQQTADGGFIIAGWTSSFGAGVYDFWLVKTDARGNKEWERTFGGSRWDWAFSVQQTADGGFIIAGWTTSFGAGWHDFWLVKTDARGNREWDRTFGGSGSDWASSVQQTADGGFIIAGTTRSFGAGGDDSWLVKTDARGNREWDRTFGGSGSDLACSVQQTADGGFIIAGTTSSFGAGERDFWLVKTDARGNREWDRTFGGSGEDWQVCRASSVQQTADGGFIIAGTTRSFGAGGDDSWLVKTDARGNREWDRTFGGSGWDWASSVQQTADGGFIIAGGTGSFETGGSDFWLAKVAPPKFSDGTLNVTPETETISIGATQQFIAEGGFAVTWSSSNPEVATVDATGLVTGVSAGTATISAATVDGNFTDTSVITVKVPPTPPSTKFQAGDKVEVIWSQLRFREAPGTGAREITTLSRGQQGSVLSHQDNGLHRDGHHWWHVEFGGQKGWVAEGGLKEQEIINDIPRRPVAHFTASIRSPAIGQTVVFDASASHDPNGEIVRYDWDFGDRSPHAGGKKVHHNYQNAATFTVRLTVTDNDGLTASREMALTVRTPVRSVIMSVTPRAKGIALEGIPFKNTYTASVVSKTPLREVIFMVDGQTVRDTDGNDGWSADLDIGILRGDPLLEVIAVDEKGREGEPYTLRIETHEVPDWLRVLFNQAFEDGRIRFVKDIRQLDRLVDIPDHIPGMGKLDPRFKAHSKKVYIEYKMPQGTAHIVGSGNLDLHIPSQLIIIGGEGKIRIVGRVAVPGFELIDINIEGDIGGSFGKRFKRTKAIKKPPAVIPLTATISAHPGVGLKGTLDSQLRLTEATLSPRMGLTGRMEGKVIVLFPPVIVEAEGGLTGNLVGNIRFRPEQLTDVNLRAYLKGDIETEAYGQTLWSHSGYIASGYIINPKKNSVSTKEAAKFSGATSLQGEIPVGTAPLMAAQTPAGVRYGRLTQNEVADDTPAVMRLGEDRYLAVWSGQNATKDPLAGHDLYYAVYENTTGWSEIRMLTDDRNDDRVPALGRWGEKTVAVWSRVYRTFTEGEIESPLEIFPYFEVAYSTWDGNAWSSPELLTNDAVPDYNAHISDGIIVWESVDGIAANNVLSYRCLNSGISHSIENASYSAVAGSALAYYDRATERIVFGRLGANLELEPVWSHGAPDFTGLGLTYYDGAHTLAWIDGGKLFVATPPGEPEQVKTEGIPLSVEIRDFGRREVLFLEAFLPGDSTQGIFYKSRYEGKWALQRILAGGADITPRQADFAAATDGFFAVFAGKELPEEQNDIFYLLHRFAGDIAVSATVEQTGEFSTGDTVTINYTVKNIGDQITPGFRVFLNNINMKELAYHDLAGLKPGSGFSGSFTAEIDSSGGFIVKAAVTPDLDLENNKYLVRLLHSDLLVREVKETRQGNNLTLGVTFENIDEADTHEVKFKLFNYDGSLYNGVVDIPAKQKVAYNITIPVDRIERNQNTMILIDADNRIEESNEENNILRFRALLPDLSLDKGAIRAISNGDNLLLRALVKNNGTGHGKANFTLLDRELNAIKSFAFEIAGKEDLPVFKDLEIPILLHEWEQVSFAVVEAIYGDVNVQDNFAPIAKEILQSPKALFTAEPTVKLAGKAVSFNAASSTDADGNITEYIWKFGDGNSLITENPYVEHIYSEPGEYTVTLTVTDNHGIVHSTSQTISVAWPPELIATIAPNEAEYDLFAPADVSTVITWNRVNVVTSVYRGVYELVPVADYTVTAAVYDGVYRRSTLTVLNSFIAGLAPAAGTELPFIINFDTGPPATLTVTVVDTTPLPEVIIPPAPPDEQPVVYGDLNGDGRVTAADATLVLRAAAGLIDLSDRAEAADVNNDGRITAADATLILRRAARLIDSFPAEPAK